MSTATSPPLKRRTVKYRGYEMIIEDAEQIAAGSFETVGNWSFGQILEHLAKAFETSIDGPNPRLPLPVRWFGGLFLKGRMLNHTLPAGFKFPGGRPSPVAPDDQTTTAAGLEALRRACHRCKAEKQRSVHPLFGQLDTAEWDRFNLRHAELHMSFVVPTGEEDDQPAQQPSTAPETTHAT